MAKNLLILGAGPNQLPGILKAKELGYYVITVDNVPDNVGHQLSDQSLIADIVDKTEVWKSIEKVNIDGVVTFAEIACPTQAYIASALGLPGPALNAVETIIRKDSFRSFQRKNGLAAPNAHGVDSLNEVLDIVQRISFPLVFKPVDSTSSRGLSVLRENSREGIEDAFMLAKQFSISGTVCVEEFVEGVEVGGDGFLVDGKIQFLGITHKRIEEFVPIGHSVPTNLLPEEVERVKSELSRTCSLIGLENGPINFDIIVSPIKTVVLEMSPRLGANGIANLCKYSFDADLTEKTLRYAMGDDVRFSQDIIIRPAGSVVIRSKRNGRVLSLNSIETVRRLVPEIVEMNLLCAKGDLVEKFTHGGHSLGNVIFDLVESDYSSLVERIDSALELKLS